MSSIQGGPRLVRLESPVSLVPGAELANPAGRLSRGWQSAAFCFSLLIIVVVYAAIPFYSIPSLGGIVPPSGFAQSFVNGGWPAIKATNFGLPTAAPIEFGLPGVFLQSAFIRFFGLHPSDAYSLGAILWLALALWGTMKFCQFLGANFLQSVFLSLIYLTLPLVWWHAQYSFLSFGFALLPLYVFLGLRVVYTSSSTREVPRSWITASVLFALTSVLAVLMDGYTFVMLFTACGLIWLVAFLRGDVSRKGLLGRALPVFLVSAIVSYLLYTTYLGVSGFWLSTLDQFRAWGVDLTMLVVPTRGISWFWDALHVSIVRNQFLLFGDPSLWSTTFALPLIIVGGIGLVLSRRHRLALPLLLMALVGFYLSLGPSLKVNSQVPLAANGQATADTGSMPANLAKGPTGSAFLDQYVPGFDDMRAPYRWVALMLVGLFGAAILFYRKTLAGGYKAVAPCVAVLLILSNLPNLPQRLQASHDYRTAMHVIDQDFAGLSSYVGKDALVFFVPPGNDWMANYLTAMGNYRSYNVGGDRNVEIAKANWPPLIYSFTLGNPRYCPANIRAVLQQNLAAFVIIPYFDMYYSASTWPQPETTLQSYQQQDRSTVAYFKNNPAFVVRDEPLYAVISLAPGKGNTQPPGNQLQVGQSVWIATMTCETNSLFESILRDGWYDLESWGAWSSQSATMVVGLPPECQNREDPCHLHLTFTVSNASAASPKTVQAEIHGSIVAQWVVSSGQTQQEDIPLAWDPSQDAGGQMRILLQVPNATSAWRIGHPDRRVLGVGLQALELMK